MKNNAETQDRQTNEIPLVNIDGRNDLRTGGIFEIEVDIPFIHNGEGYMAIRKGDIIRIKKWGTHMMDRYVVFDITTLDGKVLWTHRTTIRRFLTGPFRKLCPSQYKTNAAVQREIADVVRSFENICGKRWQNRMRRD